MQHDDSMRRSERPNASTPTGKWVAVKIQTLLSHYFQPGHDDRLAELAMVDWIEALAGLTAWEIDMACREHLKAEPDRRPTPGGIRKRALALRADQMAEQRRALPPPPPEPPRAPADAATRRAIARQLMAEIYGRETAVEAPPVAAEPPDPARITGAQPSPELIARYREQAEDLARWQRRAEGAA